MKFVKWVITIVIFIAMAMGIFRFFVLPEYILPIKYSEFVEKYSREYDIDKYLVYAVIYTESKFKDSALSHKEAKGLMQITESTGAWAAEKMGIEGFETEDLYEPETNIRIGCWYLRELLNQFEGVDETALAAYNAGNGKVSEWLGNADYSKDGKKLDKIPYEETLKYVKKVDFIKKLYVYIYD